MKLKHFFWCSKIHISDFPPFFASWPIFSLVLNQTNEHDIIYLYGFLVFIFVGKGPIYFMTFGLHDYLYHKTLVY